MVESRLDARQSRSRDLLDQLANLSDTDLDALVRGINAELTKPFRLTLSSPYVINVGALSIQNPNTERNNTVPPIVNALPFSWTDGNITVPSVNNNNITNDTGGPTILLNLGAGEFVRMGVSVNGLGQIIITLGDPNTTLNLATVPPITPGTFSVGYVVLQENAGNIEAIENEDIFQYVADGFNKGGDANQIEQAIRDQLDLSPYKAATPVVFELSDLQYIEQGSSTGAYDASDFSWEFTLASQVLTTKQMLDSSEFLGKEKNVHGVDLNVYWRAGEVDAGATYEISKDGGESWDTITMERTGDATSLYNGTLDRFTTNDSVRESELTVGLSEELNTTTTVALAQAFVPSEALGVKSVNVRYSSLAPFGGFIVKIARDNGGLPGDIVTCSNITEIPDTGGVASVLSVPVSETILNAGETYHLIIATDGEYKANYVAATNSVSLEKNASEDGMSRSNAAGTWVDAGSEGMPYEIVGYFLDLRARVTSSGAGKVKGIGVYYDLQVGTVVQGIKNFDRRDFLAVADNLDTFNINFTPDPELFEVYHVQDGKVYKYPAFTIDGNTISFAPNFFDNGGIEQTQTLLFMQSKGSSFDNSDTNANLLAANHLGSSDPTVDRSVSGRGIILRRPDGTLVEITVDNSNVITATPI